MASTAKCMALAFLWLCLYVSDSQQDDDELKLVKDLFLSGYNKNVRPVEDKNLPVEVKFGIAYTQIVDLIEKDQVLESNIWVRMKWQNHLLKWNYSEYGGIKAINITPLLMWLPDIVLHNNAEENLPSGTLDQFKTKVQLNYKGECTWYAPTILRSGCNIDITYFPFDDQLCELKFGSWTFNGLQVNIVQMTDEADLNFYMKSSEFQLISAKAKRNVVRYSCCPEPYPDVTFYLHLRRKPGFFLYNIIIPCLVITSLAVLTFLLPPEIGERVTLVIESFLALSFVILMVSSSVPVTSDNTPLIMKFLLISMCQIGCALIANCISLNLYKKEEMPQWVRVVFLHYLARCLCISTGHPKGGVSPKKSKDEDTQDKKVLASMIHKNSYNSIDGPVSPLLPRKTSANSDHQMSKAADGIAAVAETVLKEEDFEKDRDFWIFTSIVVDRLLLIIFTLTFITSSSFIFSMVPDHYGIF
ncbi:acetylcholine receptor subunit alpha-like isoform X2 [Actinia tenebrosa]|uniref:Acetylcholine receptor subunit alpha-like isoform X2 n=1 Tax=Actinia tenebrosa TaxID=6105 RepID=A0A6P8IJU2_ACTTE|nr:acetylcholine receptor subunit alpha-like isoform X2 [Actinia tenebrosa]